MAHPPDLAEVKRRMVAEQVTQTALAVACGLSQAHLSKVLAGRVPLTGRTATQLASWISRPSLDRPNEVLLRIDRKLRKASPDRRMQIMHLLKSVEQLFDL